MHNRLPSVALTGEAIHILPLPEQLEDRDTFLMLQLFPNGSQLLPD